MIRLIPIIVLIILIRGINVSAQCPLDLYETTVAPSNDLLLYLPLDSSTTNLGTGLYTMTLSGASYVSTQCGSGLEFDGVNDYLEISPSMEAEMDDDFTITAWIKLYSQTDKMGIFSIREQCSSTYRGFSMAQFNFGEYNVPGLNYQVNKTVVCNTGSGGDRYNNPLMSIVNNKETFVAVSVQNNSSENRIVKLYVYCNEFTSVQTLNFPTDMVFDTSYDFITTIGASSTSSGFYNTIDGVIDEFRIYTSILDEEEILDVYQSCLPLKMNISNFISCGEDSALVTLYNTEIDVEYQLMDITNNQIISPLVNGNCDSIQFYTGILSDTTSFEITASNQVSNCSITLDTLITLFPTSQVYYSQDSIYLCEGDSILINSVYYHTAATVSDTIPITNYCDLIEETTLFFSPIPTLNLGPDTTLCDGDVLLLNVGFPNVSYLWQDNSTESTFSVDQIGLYWLEVNDGNCSSRDSININYNPNPYVNLGNDTSLCEGSSLALDATNINYSYLWQDGSINATYDVVQAGEYFVIVSENNCNYVDTISISYTEYPIVNLGSDTLLCDGDVFLLNAGFPNISYLWQDNTINPTYSVEQTGIYWVEANDNNCITTDSIDITYNPLPYVGLGNDTSLCNGESITLDATASNLSYLWQDNSENSTFFVNQEGNYWIEVSDDNCSFTDSISISYPVFSPVNLGEDISLCEGDVLVLNTGSSSLSYLWQNNSTESTFSVNQMGLYWVEVNENNCISVDSIYVIYNPLPYVELGNDTSLCAGESILLSALGDNLSYLWQNSSIDPTYIVNQGGSYWVMVSENNCSYSDTINISYIGSTAPNLGEDAVICDGEKLVLDAAITYGNYQWQDNSTNSTFVVDGPGTYWVNAINNCHAYTDSINVSYIDCNCNIYMPNAFTPSGDGRNDFYGAVSDCSYDEFHLLIFNRWGEVVFESTDIHNYWDGRMNNDYCQSGVYSYVLKYSNNNKEFEGEITGALTLLR